MNTMKLARMRQMAASALTLLLIFVFVHPMKAQLQTARIALMPDKMIQRPVAEHVSFHQKATVAVALVGARNPVLNLTESDFRTYDGRIPETIDSPGNGNASPFAAMQVAPPSITPPGIFDLPPIPGTPQTPTTEALRARNINLGELAVWIRKRVSHSKIGGSTAPQ